ncbi:cilia- and flagella-associated protein 91-like [Cimex lectularius]|uniref:Cilia- and flagella-associated protein 91 n=1 Tax=Cimex lectularius TaxID=79782 RepID=A0A8I6RUP3_CIMLE|nr:cilia- and flagella-associated protein 91-like [Cimex lectularius]
MTHSISSEKHERKLVKTTINCECQTLFRDSETQTHVWTPGYVVKSGDPEVLQLTDFYYGKNLPAGRHEVEIIERMRKRKAWDRYLSVIYTDDNQDLRSKIISDIEMNENMFREREFELGSVHRLTHAYDMIKEFQDNMEERNEERLKLVMEKNEELKNKTAKKLHCQKSRIYRKIHKKLLGINMKYHKTSIFEEICDETSDLYVNIMRFGANPRYRHENLVPEATKAILEIPEKKHTASKPRKKIEVKSHNCQQKLMVVGKEEFIAMKPTLDISKKGMGGKSPVTGITSFKTTQDTDIGIVPERPFLEKVYQATVLFQRLIRGRAIQALMQIGVERNRDLIDELKGSFGFTPSDEEEINSQRYLKMSAFRDYYWLLRKFGMVATVMKKLTGATINSLADFANKELMRIQDERRAYKIVQVAERARWRREAAESGRRQKEIRRRRQHDEMYRQVMRSNEITTDFYLKLLTDSAIRTVSREQAHEKMIEYADELDKEDKRQAQEDKTQIEREQMAAEIVHSFLLPESEKEIVRKRIAQQQEKAKDFARRVLYGKLEGRKFSTKKETTLLEDLSGNIETLEEDDDEQLMVQTVPEEPEAPEETPSSESFTESDEADLVPLPKGVRIKEFDELSIGSYGSLLKQFKETSSSDIAAEGKPYFGSDDSSVGSRETPPVSCSLLPPISISVPAGDTMKDMTQGNPTKAYQKNLEEIKARILKSGLAFNVTRDGTNFHTK